MWNTSGIAVSQGGLIMKLRRILLIPAVGLLGVVAAPITSASAVDIPAEALDFALTINPLSAADLPQTCDKSPTEIGAAVLGGATSVTITCTVTNPKQPITGTAVNTRLAASDPGFNNGTIDASCNAQQQFTINLQISGGVSNPSVSVSTFSGIVLQSCTFSLAFKDAQSSSLAGTIEVNGTVNGDTAAFTTTKKIELAFTADVYITAGTGAFSGYVGNGKFSQTQTLDMSDKVPSRSGGGSSVDMSQFQQVCQAAGLSTCTADSLRTYCNSGSVAAGLTQVCTQFLQMNVTSSRVSAASVRKATTASKMTLTLKKGVGQVRISAPTPAVGKTKATMKSTTKISLVATPKASCTVTTNTGKVVGKAKVNAKGTATVRPAANAYKGAGSVRATCTLNKKSFKSAALKISAK